MNTHTINAMAKTTKCLEVCRISFGQIFFKLVQGEWSLRGRIGHEDEIHTGSVDSE